MPGKREGFQDEISFDCSGLTRKGVRVARHQKTSVDEGIKGKRVVVIQFDEVIPCEK